MDVVIVFSSLVGSGSSLARRISETHLDFAVAMKMVNTASETEGGDWEGGREGRLSEQVLREPSISEQLCPGAPLTV